MIIGKYEIDFYPGDEMLLKPGEIWVKKAGEEGAVFNTQKLMDALEKALDEFWAENF